MLDTPSPFREELLLVGLSSFAFSALQILLNAVCYQVADNAECDSTNNVEQDLKSCHHIGPSFPIYLSGGIRVDAYLYCKDGPFPVIKLNPLGIPYHKSFYHINTHLKHSICSGLRMQM